MSGREKHHLLSPPLPCPLLTFCPPSFVSEHIWTRTPSHLLSALTDVLLEFSLHRSFNHDQKLSQRPLSRPHPCPPPPHFLPPHLCPPLLTLHPHVCPLLSLSLFSSILFFRIMSHVAQTAVMQPDLFSYQLTPSASSQSARALARARGPAKVRGCAPASQ